MIDAHTIETLRLRTAALHRIGRANDALRAEVEMLRQRNIEMAEANAERLHRAIQRAERAEAEVRDREATERDVRARLTDAENTLARVAALTDGLCDCGDESCLEWAWGKAINAALDGKP